VPNETVQLTWQKCGLVDELVVTSWVTSNNFSRKSSRDLNSVKRVLKELKRVKHGGIRLFCTTLSRRRLCSIVKMVEDSRDWRIQHATVKSSILVKAVIELDSPSPQRYIICLQRERGFLCL
jgi:hypothetical protein